VELNRKTDKKKWNKNKENYFVLPTSRRIDADDDPTVF
jgi:hypothetical protein